jgi:aminoglycoside 6'-N-acetyltransferase
VEDIAVAYSFRPAKPSDLPMLRQWLRTPEVEGDLNEPLMVMRIVLLDGRPFAYAQDYDVGSWPQAQFAHLPTGSRAIDAFIGEPEMIGRGHGGAFLRLLAQQLIDDGAPVVAIDPDARNVRAQRAYENAGFVQQNGFAPEGDDITLMIFRVPIAT